MKKSQTGVYDPNISVQLTSFGTDVDLTAQAGCPMHEAERLEVHNDESTTQDIVITRPHPHHDEGRDEAYEVPADSIRVIRGPVIGIKADGTETIASVNVFWYHDGSTALNPSP